MTPGVTRNELRKVRSIATLIGEESLLTLTERNYQCLRGLHVYVSKNQQQREIAVSIWDAPKEEQTSHCLFSDKISESAFSAALEYWHPRYPPPPSFR